MIQNFRFQHLSVGKRQLKYIYSFPLERKPGSILPACSWHPSARLTELLRPLYFSYPCSWKQKRWLGQVSPRYSSAAQSEALHDAHSNQLPGWSRREVYWGLSALAPARAEERGGSTLRAPLLSREACPIPITWALSACLVPITRALSALPSLPSRSWGAALT